MVTFMTICKAVTIRRRNGGPSSRLIQTFLREGNVFQKDIGRNANLVLQGSFTTFSSPLQTLSMASFTFSKSSVTKTNIHNVHG